MNEVASEYGHLFDESMDDMFKNTWWLLEDVHSAALAADYDGLVSAAQQCISSILSCDARFYLADNESHGYMKALSDFNAYQLDAAKIKSALTRDTHVFLNSEVGMLVLHAVATRSFSHGVLIFAISTNASQELLSLVTVAAKSIAFALDGMSREDVRRKEFNAMEGLVIARTGNLIRPSLYDPMTDLPNRDLFRDRLSVAIARSKRTNAAASVVLLQLDENLMSQGYPTFMHANKVVADRLRTTMRTEDTIAYYSNNLFAIVITGLREVSSIDSVLAKVQKSISEPIIYANKKIDLDFYLGCAVFPNDAKSIDDLMHCVDGALEHAKNTGKRSVRFSHQFSSKTSRRATLEKDLPLAIIRDQLRVAYQPQVYLETGVIYGFEALVRWVHPEFGFVSPIEFIQMAESIGEIGVIGEWVMQQACKRHLTMRDMNMPKARVAVNLSAQQFLDPNLVGLVEATMIENKMLAGDLEIEVTESMSMHGAELCIDILERLEKLGVTISIDDFGTGYSNLAYLRKYPISALKIDRAFITDIDKSFDDEVIVRSLVAMSHEVGLHVIAEGIENELQAEILKKTKCDIIQGYWIGKPMFEDECNAWIKKRMAN